MPDGMQGSLREVTAAQASQRLAAGEAVILDVRDPDEWAAGHIEGAVHIPLGLLGARWRELEGGQPVIAVCRTGARSAAAADALRGAGVDAANLDGGMKAWVAAGLPLHAPGARVA